MERHRKYVDEKNRIALICTYIYTTGGRARATTTSRGTTARWQSTRVRVCVCETGIAAAETTGTTS